MHGQAVTRCFVLMSSAGWLLLIDATGCAHGEGDAALDDVVVNGGTGATSDAGGDATGNASGDATEDTGGGDDDALDASDVRSATYDAAEASDGGADTSLAPDASRRDAGTTRDASLDAAADVVDARSPLETLCTTSATCGAQALCITGFCLPARRVFVSNRMFTGSLGGTSGADNSCQSSASAAGLGGSWKAWVSDSTTSPSTRFTHAGVPYRLLDGTLLAADWTALTSGALLHGIDLTEQRSGVGSSNVWTGTLASGIAIGSNVCGGFTSSANGATHAVIGNTSRTDVGWTNATAQSCEHNNVRLYCMEQ